MNYELPGGLPPQKVLSQPYFIPIHGTQEWEVTWKSTLPENFILQRWRNKTHTPEVTLTKTKWQHRKLNPNLLTEPKLLSHYVSCLFALLPWHSHLLDWVRKHTHCLSNICLKIRSEAHWQKPFAWSATGAVQWRGKLPTSLVLQASFSFPQTSPFFTLIKTYPSLAFSLKIDIP